jgi:hypothetical protein
MVSTLMAFVREDAGVYCAAERGTDRMKMTSYGAACLVLMGLCGSRDAPAQSQATPPDVKMFVTQYVAAFNAKDMARLQALYHPRSLACITSENRSFYEDEITAEWRDPIPKDYTLSVSPVNENNLKAIEQFGKFPVRPDQELQINYQLGDRGGMVAIYLVRDNGRLFEDYPCATDQTIKQYRDDAPARAQRAAHYKALTGANPEPLRSQVMALLREHKTSEATTRYKEASGQDYGTSMHVIDVLAHEAQQ